MGVPCFAGKIAHPHSGSHANAPLTLPRNGEGIAGASAKAGARPKSKKPGMFAGLFVVGDVDGLAELLAQWSMALTISSVIFLASPSSIMVPSL